MTKIHLGKLEKVDLRKVWSSEATDFTPWLAQEDNLTGLGSVLGLQLELESIEKNVGPFRADILCKDINTDHWVLIENQIEKTDHLHLGQIITYAAGLKAVTIIWIASKITDEHRAALDWLNEITEDEINFFGLEVEAWRIGDSAVAPKFNIVSRPNEWVHSVSKVKREIGELSETKRLQLEYWTFLKEFMEKKKSSVSLAKPAAQHWMYLAAGKTETYLMLFTNTKEKRIGVGVVLGGIHGKDYYKLLEIDRAEIEAQLEGMDIEWRALPDKKESHIILNNRDCDLFVKGRWNDYAAWMADRIEKFAAVFRKRIKDMPIIIEPDNNEVET